MCSSRFSPSARLPLTGEEFTAERAERKRAERELAAERLERERAEREKAEVEARNARLMERLRALGGDPEAED